MKYELPKRFESFIDLEAYVDILNMIVAFFRNKGKIEKIENGIVYVKNKDGKSLQCALDNLVRICAQTDREDWFDLVFAHFDKIEKVDVRPAVLQGGFEKAKDYLMLRLYPKEFVRDDELRQKLVLRTDLEETITALVLNLPDKFQLITRQDVKDWTVTDEELFRTGQDNVNKQKVEMVPLENEAGFAIYLFSDADYAATYMLDFERNASFAIGKYGALMAVPTKSMAIVHPIESDLLVLIIEFLIPFVMDSFNENPGNLTYHLYWYYQGKFQKFPINFKDEYMTFSLPEELYAMLKKDLDKPNLN